MKIEQLARNVEEKLRTTVESTPEQIAERQAIIRDRLRAQAAKDQATLNLILSDPRPVSVGRLVKGGRLKRCTTRLARRIIAKQRKARAKFEYTPARSPLMRAHDAIARHQTWLNNKELRNGN